MDCNFGFLFSFLLGYYVNSKQILSNFLYFLYQGFKIQCSVRSFLLLLIYVLK